MSREGRIPLPVLRRRRDRLTTLVDEREREEYAAERESKRTARAKLGNRARFIDGVLVLPGFTLFKSGGGAPHRHRTLAQYTDDNGTRFAVRANWPRTKWWVDASKGGFRMSNTASTTSKEVADRWVEAVESGNVDVAESK